MTKEVIVLLSHLPWDFPTDYIKQTSLQLAKKAKVVIFSPLDFPTIRQVIAGEEKASTPKKRGIIHFHSFGFFPFQRFRFIKKSNIFLNLFLFRFYYLLKFGRQKPIFWAFSHRLAPIENYFRWGKFLVYDRVDQVASLDPKANEAMRREDRNLLRTADYVFTNSPYALKYIKRHNKASFLVPCGCTVKLFLEKKTTQPREIKNIKKPIIGLVGSIDHRLDFKILYPLAKKRKDWSFVFIGSAFSQELAQFKIAGLGQSIKKLKELSNVYFLGQKPKQKMPDFIASFDVCLIPYDLSQEFVKGCNPMKLYEYLAMGKPVVSTPIEAVEFYEPVVKIAEDARGFDEVIAKILRNKDNQKEILLRKKIALENSWEEKAKQMWRGIFRS